MKQHARTLFLVLCTNLIALVILTTLGWNATAHAQSLDWIEPRGISVVDLIDVVPDEHLEGSIVFFHPGVGMALYESGERVDSTVTLTVRYVGNPLNVFFCPTASPNRDHWASVMPASTMRLFSGGADITAQVNPIYFYYPARQSRPIANATEFIRYARIETETVFNANGEIETPANIGCFYYLPQSVNDLTATFTFETPQYIKATHLGSDSGTFRSYIGPGAAGFLDSLRNQMQSRFGDRHDDISINPPDGTEFILFHYPPTPVDPYGDVNARNAGAGTYRIRRPSGKLSVDHFGTMGIPLYGQFQDADQSAGREFLPFFSDGVRVSSPEYFVPKGIAYDPCMSNGGCSGALLDQIYDVEMSATVHFYSVERIADGLTQIPLRQVGPNWSPLQVRAAQQDNFIWLPLVDRPAVPLSLDLPADDPTNCPCGWFDADYRMVDFVAGP